MAKGARNAHFLHNLLLEMKILMALPETGKRCCFSTEGLLDTKRHNFFLTFFSAKTEFYQKICIGMHGSPAVS